MWEIWTVIAFGVMVGSLIALFFKRYRRKAFLALLASVVVSGVSVARLADDRAREAGFLSSEDRFAAERAGVTDPVEWDVQRDVVAAREREQARLAAEAEERAAAEAAAREIELQALREPPADQAALLAAIAEARSAYRSAANDMARGATRPQRGAAICKALRSRQVQDWTGVVSKLSSNGEGKGVLTIRIGDDVWAGTWNNAFSDIGSDTLIAPGSPVMNSAMRLSEGQWVRFSGTFLQDDTDCVREQSMTMDGSMRRPEFVFRFSSIEPL